MTETAQRKPRILLGDEDPRILEVVHRLLATDYVVVGVATDGVTLLDVALNVKPDIVILEVSLPELDGVEVALRLRDRGSAARVIFFTTHDERFEKVCQDAGARAFVWKPRVTEDLLPAVQAVLAGDTFFLRD